MSSSIDWPALFCRPPDFADGPVADRWFAAIAKTLLNHASLRVNGVPHRLIEVEAYYHGPGHEDPFAHRDPVQLHLGQCWCRGRGNSEAVGGAKVRR